MGHEKKVEGSQGSFIPEDSRNRKASIMFDAMKRTGVMTYSKVDEEAGRLVEKRKEVAWWCRLRERAPVATFNFPQFAT
jgi:hypothetical protein